MLTEGVKTKCKVVGFVFLKKRCKKIKFYDSVGLKLLSARTKKIGNE